MKSAKWIGCGLVWWVSFCLPATEVLASPQSALGYSGYIPGRWLGGGTPLVGSVTVGWEFCPREDIWVTGLGFYDYYPQDGLNMPHRVGIWDADRDLLVSAKVEAGCVDPLIGEYRFVSVAPVLLTGGRTYTLGATAPAPCSGAWVPDAYPFNTLGIDPQTIVLDPSIQLISANSYESDQSGGSWDDPLVFPSQRLPSTPRIDFSTGQQVGTIEPYSFAANFQFTAAPEPGALGLIALGGLAVLRSRPGGTRRTAVPRLWTK